MRLAPRLTEALNFSWSSSSSFTLRLTVVWEKPDFRAISSILSPRSSIIWKLGLLVKGEVGPLNVLHEHGLHLRPEIHVSNDAGKLLQTGQLRGCKALWPMTTV